MLATEEVRPVRAVETNSGLEVAAWNLGIVASIDTPCMQNEVAISMETENLYNNPTLQACTP